MSKIHFKIRAGSIWVGVPTLTRLRFGGFSSDYLSTHLNFFKMLKPKSSEVNMDPIVICNPQNNASLNVRPLMEMLTEYGSDPQYLADVIDGIIKHISLDLLKDETTQITSNALYNLYKLRGAFYEMQIQN